MLLFLLGTGRCGSSLVHETLARHPDVGFVSNVDDRLTGLSLRGRWNNALYRRLPAELTRKGRLRYAPSEAYDLLTAEVSPVLATTARDLTADDVTPWLARRLRDFFDRRRQVQRKPVFSHKLTGWPRAGLLGAVFPDARFVHVVRDGRAVANSFLQTDWWGGYGGVEGWRYGPLPDHYRSEWERSGRSSVVLAGITWKLLLDAYDEAERAAAPDRWLNLRYEDVLDDPRGQFKTLLEFAALDASPAFDRALDRMKFSRSRAQAYRQDLGDRQLAALESCLAGHLARRGYPVP